MPQIKLQSKDHLEKFLITLAKTSVAKTMKEAYDDNGVGAAERDKQSAFSSSIKAAVGTKEKDDKKTQKSEEDDDAKADKQKAKAADDSSGGIDLTGGDDSEEIDLTGGAEETGGEDAAGWQPEPGDVDMTMIVKQINTLRSGRSTDDDQVHVGLTKMIDGMDDEKKLELWKGLKAISDILAAPTQPQPPKPEAPEKKQVDASAGSTPKAKPAASSEDMTPPITVGAAQSTESIRRKMKLLW